MGEESIRVVVADDQTVIRESVAAMLGLQPDLVVVGTAANGAEALLVAGEHRPDVVLMDLDMPLLDGAEATARLQQVDPEIGVLVLTTHGDEASIMRALDAGARGYLTKDAGRDQIAAAIRAVAAGEAVLDRAVQQQLIDAALGRTRRTPTADQGESAGGDAAAAAGLTPRETEVLRLIAGGDSNRQIARTLVVSEATVKTHINNLFAKLGVDGRSAAVTWAFRSGLAGL